MSLPQLKKTSIFHVVPSYIFFCSNRYSIFSIAGKRRFVKNVSSDDRCIGDSRNDFKIRAPFLIFISYAWMLRPKSNQGWKKGVKSERNCPIKNWNLFALKQVSGTPKYLAARIINPRIMLSSQPNSPYSGCYTLAKRSQLFLLPSFLANYFASLRRYIVWHFRKNMDWSQTKFKRSLFAKVFWSSSFWNSWSCHGIISMRLSFFPHFLKRSLLN